MTQRPAINILLSSIGDQYFTKQYRRQDFKVTKCKIDIANFTLDIESLSKDLQEKLPTHLKSTVFEKLNKLQLNIEAQISSRITKKFNALYGGQILHKKDINHFINLSSFELSQKQKELLSLGPKCHYKPKFSSLKKHAELETLYDSILKLQTENIITVTPNLKHLLKAEATKNRNFNCSTILRMKTIKQQRN